jgi:hypothetical protein
VSGETIVCDECGFVGPARKPRKRGSALMERLIWVLFLFPGIFYSFWRRSDRLPECPKCGSKSLTPFDTPEGQALFRANLEKSKRGKA